MKPPQNDNPKNIISAAIKNGLVHPPASSPCQAERRKQSNARRLEKMKAYMRQRRDRFFAQGLTNTGKPRQRPRYQNLDGWTDEQKRERQLEQQRAWSRKHSKRNTLLEL